MVIQVRLPRDRRQLGTLTLLDADGEIVFGPVPCLGKADNVVAARALNPRRDPLRAMGDTPTGSYRAMLAGPLSGAHMFGPHRVVRLEPTAGAALVAHQNGRRGLLIHGGAPGAGGALRPTYGCIRLADAHQSELVGTLADAIGPHTCDVAET